MRLYRISGSILKFIWQTIQLTAVLAPFVLLNACSSEKTNAISISYHNTTARYNAYYIARERIREIESSIIASQDNNYDDILNVLPPLDSSIANTYDAQIEDCLKKASLVIQNHPNSRWVDDSYNLVGLARLYGNNYTHAIETFKYVFTKGENDAARHLALINLMRTYIAYNEMNNALAAADYLKKEKLNKKNLKKLYLTNAWYFQKKEDYNNMVSNLVEATPMFKPKDNKARIYFIIGQVYQKMGFESEAFSNFKKCISSNPEYELSFYARLYMARVTQLDKLKDIRHIRKDFKKLVRDAKNKEFIDRIYYEWGEFELRQNNLQEGIEKFNLSIKTSLSNPRQKGRAYLKLGQLYYDTLKNYQTAKAYYDSTIQVLPKDYEGYDDIKSRQMVLDDFVVQLNTIEIQDSLLALSKMDSVALMVLIDSVIVQQKESELAKQRALKKKSEERSKQLTNISPFESSGITSGTSNWYFNNPSALALGRSEFVRIWGNRKLEDNWRRSVKDSGAFMEEQTISDDSNVTDKASGEDTSLVESDNGSENERNSFYASVPKTAEDKNAALRKIEDAYFQLGNIYYFDLKEELNAIDAFETLITRFPETINRPDALYQLYLLYGDQDPSRAEKYKATLIASFPETTFAKLLINPNYQKESQAVNEILKKEYERAYWLFESGDYVSTENVLNNAISEYPGGNFIPNLELLKILIVGKTEGLFKYQFQLGEFIKTHPDSDITSYAKTLLTASENYKEKLIKLKAAKYKISKEDEHYFIAIYQTGLEGSEIILTEIESFNNEYFSGQNLKTGTLKLDGSNTIILVDHFNDQEKALYYYDLFKAEENIQSELPGLKFDKFVISKENFEVLYNTKELDTYRKFHALHY